MDKAVMANKSVLNVIKSEPELETFALLIESASVSDLLNAEDITVLAPNKDAFAKLPSDTIDYWLRPDNHQKLVDIVRYHLLPDSVRASSIRRLQEVRTIDNKAIHIKSEYGKVTINDEASIVQADLKCANGFIHEIDSVLMPRIFSM
jgi:uncharacterized surface protein with fasciclin (FAS1) repeats